jgi:hypothetical protein
MEPVSARAIRAWSSANMIRASPDIKLSHILHRRQVHVAYYEIDAIFIKGYV